MKASRFVYGVAVVLSTALLASCGGVSPSLLAHSDISPPSQAQSIFPPGGGAFTASYSGKFRYTGCVRFHTGGIFAFRGTGLASFLHRSIESGHLTLSILTCQAAGYATWTSVRDPKASITVTVHSCPVLPRGHSLCNWAVMSGTGKFAHATGFGQVTFKLGPRRYSDRWMGKLKY